MAVRESRRPNPIRECHVQVSNPRSRPFRIAYDRDMRGRSRLCNGETDVRNS